ncbi:hypothetical protein GCM10010129_83860 [Streptomyces fumigatiscleroticus]|nr:hypothetical protein GCM10010129_83860 [Streptomyces fumigatiscleroticus]
MRDGPLSGTAREWFVGAGHPAYRSYRRNVLLPRVRGVVGISSTVLLWAGIAGMLVDSAMMVVFGRLSDGVGRRPVYWAGRSACWCGRRPSPRGRTGCG